MKNQLNAKALEHWSEELWALACEFIGRKPETKTTTADIWIPGMKFPLSPYQWYGVFIFLLWFTDGRYGGILADSMGLGKVSEV